MKTKGEGEQRRVRVWSWSSRKDIIVPSFRSCGTTRFLLFRTVMNAKDLGSRKKDENVHSLPITSDRINKIYKIIVLIKSR